MHHELLGSLVVVCDEVLVDHANKLEVIPELFLLFSLLDMAAHRCEVHGMGFVIGSRYSRNLSNVRPGGSLLLHGATAGWKLTAG